MRRILAFALLVLCFTLPDAQTPQWLWAKNGTDSHQMLASSGGVTLAIDPTGEGVYIGGGFDGSVVHFGNISLIDSSIGQLAGFIVKYDTSGQVLWAKSIQAPYDMSVNALACDKMGNVFITGWFSGPYIRFDSLVITGGSLVSTFFIAEYDGAGNLLWAHTIQNTAATSGSWSIACDKNGNAFVTGFYNGTSVSLDTIILPDKNGTGAAFIAKYSPSGAILWARTAGADSSNSLSIGLGICTNPMLDGNLYVTGYFGDSAITFGDITLTNPDPTGHSNTFFLVKYDSSGNALWARIAPGNIFYECQPAIEDMNGNAYVTGSFSSPTLVFGTDTLRNPNSIYYPVLFIVKYDTTGNVIWAKSGTGGNGRGIGVDLWNDIYVSGGFEYDSLIIDSLSLYAPVGYPDPMFIVKYDEDGNVLCSTALTSEGGEGLNSIGADRFGNAYISGTFDRIDTFVLGPDTMFLNGDANEFTAKFTCGGLVCNPAPVTITADSNIICPNDSAIICAPPGYDIYNWSNGAGSRCIVTNLANGYQVTVTDNNHCTVVSNTVNINVYQPLPVSISISGDTLTGYDGNSYQWLLNGLPISGATSAVYITPSAGTYTLQITDNHGCSDYSNPVVITGITDVTGADIISVFPNPSSSGWHLTVPLKLVGSTLEVFDAVGRLTYQSLITNNQSVLNMPNAASGIYELRIVSLNSTIVRKLVKL